MVLSLKRDDSGFRDYEFTEKKIIGVILPVYIIQPPCLFWDWMTEQMGVINPSSGKIAVEFYRLFFSS